MVQFLRILENFVNCAPKSFLEMDILKLKTQIIDALNLEELTPEDIADDAPLFGTEGLGLDSIDALELIVLLEKNYGIKLTDPSQAKGVLTSVRAIAKFLEENQK